MSLPPTRSAANSPFQGATLFNRPAPRFLTAVYMDENQDPEADVLVSVQMETGPGTAGFILDQKIRTETSDVDGIVEFAGMLRGATYAIWRGDGATVEATGPFSVEGSFSRRSFVVPNTDTFSLAEALGIDAEVV